MLPVNGGHPDADGRATGGKGVRGGARGAWLCRGGEGEEPVLVGFWGPSATHPPHRPRDRV